MKHQKAIELPDVVAARIPDRRGALSDLLPSGPAMIAAWDAVWVLVAFGATRRLEWLPALDWSPGAIGAFGQAALAAALVTPFAAALLGLYRPRGAAPGARLAVVGRLALLAAAVCFAAGLAGPVESDQRQLALVWALLPPGWVLGRAVADATFRRPVRCLVLGSGHVVELLQQLCRRHPEAGLELVGCLDDDPLPMSPGSPRVIGGIEHLEGILAGGSVERVVVAFSRRPDAATAEALRACDRHGVDVEVVPRLFDLLGIEPEVRSLGRLPLHRVSARRTGPWGRVGKRAMDVTLAAGLLLLLAPVFLVIAAAVVLDDGRPVLYRQLRVGRGGTPFTLWKFRTMVVGADADRLRDVGAGRVDAVAIGAAVERMKATTPGEVTRVGRILRRTSLDELPQLWNVLRGDMSMVGPRPVRPFEHQAIEDRHGLRADVRPGLTGLWQVMGRSDVWWAERMELDYSYVRHWSLAWDLRILAATVRAVASGRGAR